MSVIVDNKMISCSNSDMVGILERRAAGESLKSLAGELGLSWQRLWTLLYPGAPVAGKRPVLRPNPGSPALTEKYRPVSLDAIWGQPAVVRVLKKFAAHPYPTAFSFEGATGTGKTSAALALAAELGCDLAQKEFGGVYVVASGEQTADAVRDMMRVMWTTPFYGSGWKAIIVNEADRMHPAAETIWLDRLESLAPRTVIVFTTNYPDRLSDRFRDRCTRLKFDSDAARLGTECLALLAGIWRQERSTAPDMTIIARCMEQATAAGHISFRRAVQALTVALGELP